MGELRQRGSVWWIRYYRNGERHEESSGSDKKGAARDLLRLREGKVAQGEPISAQIGRLRFADAAQDLKHDYSTNHRKSADEVERRIRLHLEPYFGGQRMAAITTADVRAYVAARQAAGWIHRHARTIDGVEPRRRPVSNGEINRELTTLKRMFSLAIQAGKLLHKPHIPLLKESNTRTGFFEPEQYVSVQTHLPAEIRPVIEFAYITGWRIASEILPLEWRNVDLRAGEVRLDAHTTKNDDGRTFPLTDDLRRLLEAQADARAALLKAGHVVPWVFWRMVAEERGGEKKPRPIRSIGKAWKAACQAAGCPGRIPHDLRRTAVRAMVRRGIPERVAMMLTGHKTRSVFERYNVVSGGDLRSAAMQLSGLTGTKKGQSSAEPPATATESTKTLRKFGGAARN